MTHEIDEDTLNSNIRYCIKEFVRQKEHRRILKEKWFYGDTLEQISAKHHISLSKTKDIVYGIGDKVLLRASEMSRSSK